MPSVPPQQLTFDLAHRTAFDAEDFLVSACNQAAIEMIDRWPAWPAPAVIISGPASSGKTHLVNVWRSRSGAETIAAGDVDETTVARFKQTGVLAIENIDSRISDQKLVFHLLNQSREQRGAILITSRKGPGDLDIALPDLRSRLRALPFVEISDIDDALLSALLVKLFTDRQLSVDPTVVKYLSVHMERSAEAARAMVEEIDRLALATHRRVTRNLAAEALRRHAV